MIIYQAVQLEANENKFNIEINGNITNNSNFFNIPILIKGNNFGNYDSFKLNVSLVNNEENVELDNLQKINFVNNNFLSTNLVVPIKYKNENIKLICSLTGIENDKPIKIGKSCELNLQLPNIKENNHSTMSTTSIISITVVIIVSVALIGWIAVLLKKRKMNNVSKKYHNKRQKK